MPSSTSPSKPSRALLEDEHPVAHLAHRAGRVADVEEGAAAVADLLHLLQALLLERLVPHREHLVGEEDVGVDVDGDREAEPGVHARGVVADRGVEELADVGELDDRRRTCAGSRPRSCPRIAALRKMFSRPVSCGWKPAPVAIRPAIRPRVSTVPPSGRITPLISLSSVLLPEPLRPIRPIDSPCSTVKETSSRAMKVLLMSLAVASRRPSSA